MDNFSRITLSNSIVTLSVTVCAAWLIILFPLDLFRLSGISTSYISDGLVLLFCVLGVLKLPFVFDRRSLLTLPFVVTAMIYSYALVIGVIYNGSQDVVIGLRYFVLPAAMLLVFYDASLSDLEIFVRRKLWCLVLFGHIVGYTYYFVVLRGDVYPGIGNQTIAYAGLFFLVSGNPFLFVISTLLIVLEGKRSIMLGYIISVIFIEILRRYSRGINIRFSIWMLALVSLVIFFLLYSLSMLDALQFLNRINLLNPFSNQFDFVLGSSGRLGELTSYFGSSSLSDLLFGNGFGFSYEWELGYASAQNGEIKGYFHASIVNYLVLAGVLGLFIWALFAIVLVQVSREHSSNRVTALAFAFFFMAISQSLFGFITAVDPLFWTFFVLCLLVGRESQRKGNTPVGIKL